MSDRARWKADGGWAGVVRGDDGTGDGRLRLEMLDTVPLATIIVRRGEEARLQQLLKDQLGCDVPTAGRVAFGERGHLVWSSPGQWLAVAKIEKTLADLPAILKGVGAVTDQSDSRALVRISGTGARDTLAKGVAIDLHPSRFSTGSAAVTKVGHLSVQIWQVDDAPSFMIAVPRSFAGSFWSWLSTARAPLASSSATS